MKPLAEAGQLGKVVEVTLNTSTWTPTRPGTLEFDACLRRIVVKARAMEKSGPIYSEPGHLFGELPAGTFEIYVAGQVRLMADVACIDSITVHLGVLVARMDSFEIKLSSPDVVLELTFGAIFDAEVDVDDFCKREGLSWGEERYT